MQQVNNQLVCSVSLQKKFRKSHINIILVPIAFLLISYVKTISQND